MHSKIGVWARVGACIYAQPYGATTSGKTPRRMNFRDETEPRASVLGRIRSPPELHRMVEEIKLNLAIPQGFAKQTPSLENRDTRPTH